MVIREVFLEDTSDASEVKLSILSPSLSWALSFIDFSQFPHPSHTSSHSLSLWNSILPQLSLHFTLLLLLLFWLTLISWADSFSSLANAAYSILIPYAWSCPSIDSKIYKLYCKCVSVYIPSKSNTQGQKDNTEAKVLVLHAANPNLIQVQTYSLLNT